MHKWSNKHKSEKQKVSSITRAKNGKKKSFTDEVYGAHLPHEDARILDDYGSTNKLNRSEVVRLGLHQFALRLQMRYHKKDPLREMTEQVVAEQIAPLQNGVEETAATIRQLAAHLVQTQQTTVDPASVNVSAQASTPQGRDEVNYPPPQLFSEHKQLLERTLMAAMLALRLHVNYVVEPALRNIDKQSSGKPKEQLRQAVGGGDAWSELTREVIDRTGNRILFELRMITEEDWKNLLTIYNKQTS